MPSAAHAPPAHAGNLPDRRRLSPFSLPSWGRAVLPIAFAFSSFAAAAPFAIHLTDEATGRGVPLVVLTTTNHLNFVSDSAGFIAFNEPGLMNREVFFSIQSPGYDVKPDGFGYSGVRLKTVPDATVQVKLRRQNIAERVCRLTGQGIYRDSTLLGRTPPLPEPNLMADVMGQDSVQVAEYHDRLFWLWGDTLRPGYPLGNFHCTCAWSPLPGEDSLDADQGVVYDYIAEEDGSVREMAPCPAPGPVWIFGLLAAKDKTGKQHLLGHYGRFKDLGTRVEHGIAEYDDAAGRFKLTPLPESNRWRHPEGNAVSVHEEGRDYLYFVDAFATVRAPAAYEQVTDPAAYEALAWSNNKHDYVWQNEAPPATQAAETLALKSIPAGKEHFQLQDASSGAAVLVHRSSIAWNAWRNCWIMIALQNMGKESLLGEVWYAEASSPTGPWTKAVKVASHPKYSFYNPLQHPFMQKEGGRILYFEGTYAETFSGNPNPTPRYDYNQLLYRLDLSDPRLDAAR